MKMLLQTARQSVIIAARDIHRKFSAISDAQFFQMLYKKLDPKCARELGKSDTHTPLKAIRSSSAFRISFVTDLNIIFHLAIVLTLSGTIS
jgi:hypothetical protein